MATDSSEVRSINEIPWTGAMDMILDNELKINKMATDSSEVRTKIPWTGAMDMKLDNELVINKNGCYSFERSTNKIPCTGALELDIR